MQEIFQNGVQLDAAPQEQLDAEIEIVENGLVFISKKR